MAKTCCPPLIRTCTSTAFASMPTKATVEIWPYIGAPHIGPATLLCRPLSVKNKM